MALGNGWTAWAVAAILVDGLHILWCGALLAELEHAECRLLAVLGYWTFSSGCRSRPAADFSSMSAYIQNLHLRVKNDLDTLGVQR